MLGSVVVACATFGTVACGNNPEGTSERVRPNAGAGGEAAEAGESSGGTAGRDSGANGGAAGAPIGTGGTRHAGGPGGDAGDGGDAGGGGDAGDGGMGGEPETGGSGNRGGTGPRAGAGSVGAGMGGSVGPGGAGIGGSGASGGRSGNGGGGSGGDFGCGGGSVGPSDEGPNCAARCLEDLGENPCGTWTCTPSGECMIAGCEDSDGDGFGIGASCACPLDCDDHDDEVTVSKTAPCCRTGTGTRTCTGGVWGTCSAGTPATAEACDGEDDDCNGVPDNDLGTFTCGLGACAVTVPACVNGAVSACIPSAPTTTTDSCNGIDDDCDGAIDEDCSDCIRVAPTGNDNLDLPNRGTAPFRDVQTAIDYAYAHPELPSRVCVAAGPACGMTATFFGPCGTGIVMRNGIDVLGGFESRGWTHCSDSAVTLAPQSGRGVIFGDDIDEPTNLDGFTIVRKEAAATAGVTVSGALNVTLSNLRILDGPYVTASYGVNVTNGAEVTIARSVIDGGRALDESIGVRSFESRVFIEDCRNPPPSTSPATACDFASIRGPTRPNDGGSSIAVLLDRSPDSRIEQSSLCTTTEDIGRWLDALLVRGDARGLLVRGNTIRIESRAPDPDVDTNALLFQDCAGASPWIVGNTIGSTDAVTALASYGDCHPVIDSNASVSASFILRSNGSSGSTAIQCGTANGTSSRCVISNNPQVGVSFDMGPWNGPVYGGGTGVSCASCPKISRNGIAGLSGPTPYSFLVFVGSTGLAAGGDSLIQRNRITGGCASGSAVGASVSGNATVVNNVITGFAGKCGGSQTERLSAEGLVIGGGNVNVHSNYVRATAGFTLCTLPWRFCSSAGVKFTGATSGIFRNNRFFGGPDDSGIMSNAFLEDGANADPTVFENNAFGTPSYYDVYTDEGSTRLVAAAVNGLTDMTTAGNIAQCAPDDAMLTSSSTCRNQGTTAGAPRVDIDGQLRDGQPDIGPDEYVP